MALTKNALAEAVQNGNGLLLKQSREAIEIILSAIKQALASGEDVLISGFGKFEVREKGARKGRNPATGGELLLRSRKVVTFKISGKLKDRLNRGPAQIAATPQERR